MLYIIYPGEDKTRLEVFEIAPSYQVRDYAVASRHTWELTEKPSAIKYAKQLAKENGLTYTGCQLDGDSYTYLD